jgi:hypothetical protein
MEWIWYLVSGEGSLSVHRWLLLVSSHGEGGEAALWGLLYVSTNPICEDMLS